MKSKFDAIDTLVLIAILSFSIFIGLFHGFRQKLKRLTAIFFNRKEEIKSNENEVSEYLIASSSMGEIPIAFSLLASFFSATALVGLPAEVYTYGIEHWTIAFGIFAVPLLGAYITGPFFLRLKVMSVFEYLEQRFDSHNVRLIGMISYVVKALISAGIFIYGPATTLYSLSRIDEKIAIAAIGLIGTFYTTIGGIKAVIWTDFFQVSIMFLSLTIIILKGLYDIGGLSNLWEICLHGGRLNFFDFNPDPLIRQSSWSLFFGMAVYFSMSYCIDQQMVQRFMAAKSKRSAQNAVLLNIPLTFLIVTLCCFTGLVLYANFFHCDPLSSHEIKSPNQLVGYFVVQNLSGIPGMSGLFLGSLFCGSLSSLSSTLNSQVSIVWQDFFKSLPYFKAFDDAQSVRTTKFLVLICGFLDTVFAFVISTFGGNIVQISSGLNGSFVAPTVGLFILGALFKSTNSKGAISGTVAGFVVGLCVTFGAYFKKPFYHKLSVSTELCVLNNHTSLFIYQNFYKEKFLFENKINASFFADCQRAQNLHGFDLLFSLSYMWYCTFGTIVTVAVGLIVSRLTSNNKEVSDHLVIYDLNSLFSKRKNTHKITYKNNQENSRVNFVCDYIEHF